MLLIEKILFTESECKSILWDNSTQITNFNKEDRKYHSQQLELSIKTEWVFNRLKFFFELETKNQIVNMKEVIHLHRFVEGDWFGRHNDIRDERLYAVGVLLNDNFEGGEFSMYNPEKININKKTGNTYIFDVRIQHEVTPIINRERYSLLWFLQKEHIKLSKKHLL